MLLPRRWPSRRASSQQLRLLAGVGELLVRAREAPTRAAKAAAYAAQQAAAVAHMGAHALGAAGYAAKAVALVDDGHSHEAVRFAASSQVTRTSQEVARALSLLPVLGEDRAGPLGPGRLTSGEVAEAIRVIQARLGDR